MTIEIKSWTGWPKTFYCGVSSVRNLSLSISQNGDRRATRTRRVLVEFFKVSNFMKKAAHTLESLQSLLTEIIQLFVTFI